MNSPYNSNGLNAIDIVLKNIERILKYANGIYEDDFYKNEIMQDAIIFRLNLLVEIFITFRKELKEYNSIFEPIKNIHNKLQDYTIRDVKGIWKFIKSEIPEVRNKLLSKDFNESD